MSMFRRLSLAAALLAGLLPAVVQAAAPPPVPALPDVDRVTRYSISSSTCNCAVGFALYGDSTDYQNWLTVYVNGIAEPFNDATFGWTITSPTGPLSTIARPITDAVLTFNSAQTGTVQIVGARRPRRVSQFPENRGVSSRDLNQALSDVVAQNRETWDLWERAITFEPGFTPNALPLAAARAGQYLCFDPTGQPTTCSNTGATGGIAAGNGIGFAGSNPTTISTNLSAGAGIAIAPSGAASQISTAPGVGTNNPLNGTQTGAYTVQSSDCGNLVPLGGNAFYTVTINAPSSYQTNCVITLANQDNWGSGRGKSVVVSGLTLPITILYPQQAWTFRRIGSLWFQDNSYQLAQPPLGTKLYVDLAGSNSNDCLAPGAANACHDTLWVVMHTIWQTLVATAGSGTGSSAGFDIRLANDPACVISTGVNCHSGLHMSGIPKQTEGHNSIMIECDSGSATNCTIADAGGAQAIGVYCACNIELRNISLAGGSGNNNAIQVEKGMVRLEGGVVIAGIPTSPLNAAQFSALDGGTIYLDGGTTTTVTGGAAYFAESQYGAHIGLDGATVLWTANSSYTSVLGAFAGLITSTGTTWTNSGGVTVTATNKLQCTPGGTIDTSGTASSIPGTTTALGCTNSPNGTYN